MTTQRKPQSHTNQDTLENSKNTINKKHKTHTHMEKRHSITLLRKPQEISGNNLILRNASVADAEFILELRTNKRKSTHISQTDNILSHQQAWLESYQNDNTQIYFIILNRDLEKFGTVRIYDIQKNSFCWGSWILKEGTPSSYSIESALLIYHFAMTLGFEKSHFDVRKGNTSVWKFHERFGAERIKEDDKDYIYNITKEAIQKSIDRYKKYLPNGLKIKY